MPDPKFSTDKVACIASQCLSVRLRLLNRMVNHIYDTALRPYGVKASQVNILVAVAHSDPATSRDICGVLHMDTSTFSRTLTRLKHNGWLATDASGDGKILSISITREGLGKIEQIFPAWKQAQEDVAELLGESGMATIREVGTRHLMGKG